MHILRIVSGLTDLGRGIAASYVYLEKCFPMCLWAANEVTSGPICSVAAPDLRITHV